MHLNSTVYICFTLLKVFFLWVDIFKIGAFVYLSTKAPGLLYSIIAGENNCIGFYLNFSGVVIN